MVKLGFSLFVDVGFPVGKSEGINQLVMQIHYKDPIPGEYHKTQRISQSQ